MEESLLWNEIHTVTCVQHWCNHPALSSTSHHLNSKECQGTEMGRRMRAHQEENNNQRFTPHHFFPLSLSSPPYLPQAHLHSSPHLFFPFCCQATDRKSITWRRQNHRKSLQEDTSHRCSVKEPGSIRGVRKDFFLSIFLDGNCHGVQEKENVWDEL